MAQPVTVAYFRPSPRPSSSYLVGLAPSAPSYLEKFPPVLRERINASRNLVNSRWWELAHALWRMEPLPSFRPTDEDKAVST